MSGSSMAGSLSKSDSAELTDEICRLDNEVLSLHFTPPDGVSLQTAQVTVLLREVAKLCVRVNALEMLLRGGS